jgi:hypothetical protein
LRIFSFSSKLFCLMASWISIASWYSTYNHTHSWSSSNRSSWSPGLLEEPHYDIMLVPPYMHNNG